MLKIHNIVFTFDLLHKRFIHPGSGLHQFLQMLVQMLQTHLLEIIINPNFVFEMQIRGDSLEGGPE